MQAGHQVLGLTRSEEGAEKLRAAGAEVLHGNIEDLESLREGASKTDGVIYLAFNHDFSQFQKNADDDRKAIVAIGEVLMGSNRPFVITSGTAIAANVDGKPSTEDGPRREHLRGAVATGSRHTQARTGALSSRRGAREGRLHVHRRRQQPMAGGARFRRGVALSTAFEKAEPGAIYHAVDEEVVSMKAIVEAHARGLKIPVVSIKPQESERSEEHT